MDPMTRYVMELLFCALQRIEPDQSQPVEVNAADFGDDERQIVLEFDERHSTFRVRLLPADDAKAAMADAVAEAQTVVKRHGMTIAASVEPAHDDRLN